MKMTKEHIKFDKEITKSINDSRSLQAIHFVENHYKDLTFSQSKDIVNLVHSQDCMFSFAYYNVVGKPAFEN